MERLKFLVPSEWNIAQYKSAFTLRETGRSLSRCSTYFTITIFLCSIYCFIELYKIYCYYRLIALIKSKSKEEELKKIFLKCSNKKLSTLLKLTNRDVREKVINFCSAERLFALMKSNAIDKNETFSFCSNARMIELISRCCDAELLSFLQSPYISECNHNKIINCCSNELLVKLLKKNLNERFLMQIYQVSPEKLLMLFEFSGRDVCETIINCFSNQILCKLMRLILNLKSEKDACLNKAVGLFSEERFKALSELFSREELLKLIESSHLSEVFRSKIVNYFSLDLLMIFRNSLPNKEFLWIISQCSQEKLSILLKSFDQFFDREMLDLCTDSLLFRLTELNLINGNSNDAIFDLLSDEKIQKLIAQHYYSLEQFSRLLNASYCNARIINHCPIDCLMACLNCISNQQFLRWICLCSPERLLALLKFSDRDLKGKLFNLCPIWLLCGLKEEILSSKDYVNNMLYFFSKMRLVEFINLLSDTEFSKILHQCSNENLLMLLSNSNDQSVKEKTVSLLSNARMTELISCCCDTKLLSFLQSPCISECNRDKIINCCSDELLVRLLKKNLNEQFLMQIYRVSVEKLLMLFRVSDRDVCEKILNSFSNQAVLTLTNLILTCQSNTCLNKAFALLSEERIVSGGIFSQKKLLELITLSHLFESNRLKITNCFSLDYLMELRDSLRNEKFLWIISQCSQEKLSILLKSFDRFFNREMLNLCTDSLLFRLMALNLTNGDSNDKIFDLLSDEKIRKLIMQHCDSTQKLLRFLELGYFNGNFNERIISCCPIECLVELLNLELNEGLLTLIYSYAQERLLALLKPPDQNLNKNLFSLCPVWFLCRLKEEILSSKNCVNNMLCFFSMHVLGFINSLSNDEFLKILCQCSNKNLSMLLSNSELNERISIICPSWRLCQLAMSSSFVDICSTLTKHSFAFNNCFSDVLFSYRLFMEQNNDSSWQKDMFNGFFETKLDYLSIIKEKDAKQELAHFLQENPREEINRNQLHADLDNQLADSASCLEWDDRVKFSNMITCILERKSAPSAPPFGSAQFANLYQDMEDKLRFIIYRLKDRNNPIPQEQKESVFLALVDGAKNCINAWHLGITNAVNGICGGSMETPVTFQEFTMKFMRQLVIRVNRKLIRSYRSYHPMYDGDIMEVHIGNHIQRILYTLYGPRGYPQDALTEGEAYIPELSLEALQEDLSILPVIQLFEAEYSPYEIVQMVFKKMNKDRNYANLIYTELGELARRWLDFSQHHTVETEPRAFTQLRHDAFMDITCLGNADYLPSPLIIAQLLIDVGILEAQSPAFIASFQRMVP